MLLILLLLAHATYAIIPTEQVARGIPSGSNYVQNTIHAGLLQSRGRGKLWEQSATSCGANDETTCSGMEGNNRALQPRRWERKLDHASECSFLSPRQHASLRLRGGLTAESATKRCEDENTDLLANNETDGDEGDESWKPMCRICYEDDAEDLFSPCLCSGSMGYVHRECLRKWRAVKVGERGFTHCSMCDFEYRIREGAQSPPDNALHRMVRSLASGECAVVSTILCLAVALGGESLERTGFEMGLLFPFLRGMRQSPGEGIKEPSTAPTSPVPEELLPEPSPEEQILKRLHSSWVMFGMLSGFGILSPFSAGINGGIKLLQHFATYVMEEAEVRQAITSVWVWWIVYAACEVVFIHLHLYPKALLSTLLLYSGVAVTSLPLQWAMQLYVYVRGQPALDDVMALQEAKDIDAAAGNAREHEQGATAS